MKLLIITQKIDLLDSNLSFFHKWVEKFAENLDKVYVICLWEGKHNLPQNTHVYSLGKEKGYSKIREFLRLQKFVFRNIKNVDGIFIHMCPIYAIAVYPLAKIFRKKVILWYAHGYAGFLLKLCAKCVDKIVSSSAKGCRIKSKKIEILGQGIDTENFMPKYHDVFANRDFQILCADRISRVKNQEILVEAADILINQKNIKNVKIKFMGARVGNSDKNYFNELKNLVQEKKLENYVEFLETVSNKEMPKYYQDFDLVVNSSNTGSMDKVVLEAMACGRKVLTCNEAFENILDNRYLFKKKNSQELAEKIINLKNQVNMYDANLRKIVIENHNLDNLIKNIIFVFNK
jgi:glycosyltransferase involved in cell wall biosynthesis